MELSKGDLGKRLAGYQVRTTDRGGVALYGVGRAGARYRGVIVDTQDHELGPLTLRIYTLRDGRKFYTTI